jgi:hypothetical protein
MKTIRGKNWYTPREVADRGLIKGRTNNPKSNYFFVLKQIKSGRLAAKNYSVGSVLPFYLVAETEIERFNNLMNMPEAGNAKQNKAR